MKKLFLFGAIFFASTIVNAQSIKENFDSNTLEWTECVTDSKQGTAIIDKGVLKLKTKDNEKVGMTFMESHCYAPINVERPFTVVSHVTLLKLDEENFTGFVFNYRDGGNYYAMDFNEKFIEFRRYVNNVLVGEITQSIKWQKKRKLVQQWKLTYDGNILEFFVDEVSIFKVRHMPLEYKGFGFYTYGKQVIEVDDIEFIQ